MQWIGGRAVEALSGERIESVCPSDGRPFASVPTALMRQGNAGQA